MIIVACTVKKLPVPNPDLQYVLNKLGNQVTYITLRSLRTEKKQQQNNVASYDSFKAMNMDSEQGRPRWSHNEPSSLVLHCFILFSFPQIVFILTIIVDVDALLI